MPTVDSRSEREHLAHSEPGAKLPVWARLEAELREQGIGVEPVAAVDDAGHLLEQTRSVLAVAAAHGMVVAPGHLGRDEVFAVVDAAVEEGVDEIVVTHPDYPAQAFSVSEQLELARRGALIERCLTTPYTGKCSWERWLVGIRAVGPERSLLSSDLGQIETPPVEEGLALLAARLLAAGFGEADVRVMAVDNTRRLAGVAPA